MTSVRQLRYFVAVAEEGQMTRAARRLHLAQPALSQAIAQLEGDLGVELLRRHARGVSLTPAGEAFLGKARVALAAVEEADTAARSFSGAAAGTVECGFIGSPPVLEAPELFAAFAHQRPEVELCFRQLPFPCHSTASWLEQVDVALCYSPTPHPQVCLQVLRAEPRVVVAAASHPLAHRTQLSVAEVLDEVFCGNDPDLEPRRASFWRLDDHRGGPGRVTADRAGNPQEMVAVVASGRAIMTAPASTTRFLSALPAVVTIPLLDADPATLTLVWHADRRNPHVDALAALAASIADDAGEPHSPPG